MSVRISETDLIINPNGSVYHLGLKPEDIADVIITVGDPERVAKVSQYFDQVEHRQVHREFCAHTGWIGKQRLMVISSGMGTDNVEILLTELDALANVDFATRKVKQILRRLTIIRVGTSGSLQADVPVDSYVINQHAFGLDTLMQFYPPCMSKSEEEWSGQLGEHLDLRFVPYCATASEGLLATWQQDYTVGTTVTCPGFYAPQGREVRIVPRPTRLVKRLTTFRFDSQRLTNLEMETAGYYALGDLLGHRVVSLNAILANRVSQKFSNHPAKTIDRLIRKVLGKVETIP